MQQIKDLTWRGGTYLNKDSEEDNSDDSSEEHVSERYRRVSRQEGKGEGDGPSQATVGYDELVFGGQFDDAELVDNAGQTNNTWRRQWVKTRVLTHRRCRFLFILWKLCFQIERHTELKWHQWCFRNRNQKTKLCFGV